MNKILSYHENVLDDQYCREIFHESIKLFTTGERVWSSNYFWQGPLTKDTFPWFIRDIDEENSKKILQQLHDKGIIEDLNTEYSVLNYIGTRLSYIPWHNDGTWSDAITIYLNEEWPEDWGGLFLYKEDMNSNKVVGYQPKFNTAIKQKQGESVGVWHTVTLVSVASQCPRVTLQIFPKKYKDSYLRNFTNQM
jgi:hypothetical protein